MHFVSITLSTLAVGLVFQTVKRTISQFQDVHRTIHEIKRRMSVAEVDESSSGRGDNAQGPRVSFDRAGDPESYLNRSKHLRSPRFGDVLEFLRWPLWHGTGRTVFDPPQAERNRQCSQACDEKDRRNAPGTSTHQRLAVEIGALGKVLVVYVPRPMTPFEAAACAKELTDLAAAVADLVEPVDNPDARVDFQDNPDEPA